MTIAFNALNDIQLGYAAVFICIGFGFLCLKLIHKKQSGPEFWAASFLLNACGFLFWSGFFSIGPLLYYLVGEIFHILGFFVLVYGAIRFNKIKIKYGWIALYLLVWILFWCISIISIRTHEVPAVLTIKLLRAIVFYTGSILLFAGKGKGQQSVGKSIAAASLMLWATFVLLSAFIRMNGNLYFGFLVGFQVLAAFGMVAMLIDKLRIDSEKAQKQVHKLEGILPICSYCKKIRDEQNDWRRLEEYIEDRSKAEFSHGICPDCFAKHRPNK